jgi:hypothetical protein
VGSLELLTYRARPRVTKATGHLNTDNDGLWATDRPSGARMPGIRPSIAYWDSSGLA